MVGGGGFGTNGPKKAQNGNVENGSEVLPEETDMLTVQRRIREKEQAELAESRKGDESSLINTRFFDTSTSIADNSRKISVWQRFFRIGHTANSSTDSKEVLVKPSVHPLA